MWHSSYLLKPNLQAGGSCLGGVVLLYPPTPPPPHAEPAGKQPRVQTPAIMFQNQKVRAEKTEKSTTDGRSRKHNEREATPPSVPPSLTNSFYAPDEAMGSRGECRLGVKAGALLPRARGGLNSNKKVAASRRV